MTSYLCLQTDKEMKIIKSITIQYMGIALCVVLSISYLYFTLGGTYIDWAVYEFLIPLLPGFTWLVAVGGLLIGLLWLVGYSLYAVVPIVLPYNFLARRYDH